MRKKLISSILLAVCLFCLSFALVACGGNNGSDSNNPSGDDTPHTHTYVETITPPTCQERGYTTYTCSQCGESYKDNYTIGSHVGVGVCQRCDENFYYTLTMYMVSHHDYYYDYENSDRYGIYKSVSSDSLDVGYMIDLEDSTLKLSASILPLTETGSIMPITFSMDISKIDGSYDWKYSDGEMMSGTLYSTTLTTDSSELLYTSTTMTSSISIANARQTAAICARELVRLLADVAVAADECLGLDNFGFVNFDYIPTPYVPGEGSGSEDTEIPEIIPVSSVALEQTSLSLEVGESFSLTLRFFQAMLLTKPSSGAAPIHPSSLLSTVL